MFSYLMIFVCFNSLFINANIIEYEHFLYLNQTCYKTWNLLESTLDISKLSRADFDESKYQFIFFKKF